MRKRKKNKNTQNKITKRVCEKSCFHTPFWLHKNAMKKRTVVDTTVLNSHDEALATFPDLKQEVQTYNFCGTPLTLQLTFLMFDFQT